MRSQRWLVAVDLSEVTEVVMHRAVTWFERERSRVDTVHVVHVLPDLTFPIESAGFGTLSGKLREELEVHAHDRVVDLARRFGPKGKPLVLVGPVVRELRAAVEELDVDLVILGSHGHTRLEHLVGSVAERMARECHRSSLLVVHHRDEDPWTSVLVGVDLSEGSRIALRRAAHLAEIFKLSLHVMMVIPPWAVGSPTDLPDWIFRDATDALERFLEAEGVRVDAGVVRFGLPSEELRTYAEQHNISLVLVGARGLTTDEALTLGSTPLRLLRHARRNLYIARG